MINFEIHLPVIVVAVVVKAIFSINFSNRIRLGINGKGANIIVSLCRCAYELYIYLWQTKCSNREDVFGI